MSKKKKGRRKSTAGVMFAIRLRRGKFANILYFYIQRIENFKSLDITQTVQNLFCKGNIKGVALSGLIAMNATRKRK